MDKRDKIILEGSFVEFPDCTHDGRIYKAELFEELLRQYKLEDRQKKIQKIMSEFK